MATIVKCSTDNEEYVLLGAGFGAFNPKKGGLFAGPPPQDPNYGKFPMVCVCNKQGVVGWIKSSEIEVISVDGLSPETILSAK